MKKRSGFVTNSSSSSFILTIGIGLKDGDAIIFTGNGGSPECGRIDYFENDAVIKVSPKRLGTAATVEEMIKLLTDGVLDYDMWEENSVKIFEKPNDDDYFPDAYDFINEILGKVHSMDEISWIEVSGNEYNYRNYLQHYEYYLDEDKYVGDVFGCEFEKDGSTGGSIDFSISDCEIDYTEDEEWEY